MSGAPSGAGQGAEVAGGGVGHGPTRTVDSAAAEAGVLLAQRLRRRTQGEVQFDAAARGRYATDASIYQVMPLGVFVPRTAEDVAAALDVARELQVPVLARGAGTSQCGQTVGAALVIDCSKHLRRVLAIDWEARCATVEPGVVLDQLNAQLKPRGLWFAVDVSTGAQATLGGMAGNNSCGSRSIAYGNMVHNVLGMQAWLADGELVVFGPEAGLAPRAARIAALVGRLATQNRDEIEQRWPKVLRRVGGYNLDIYANQSPRPYTADGSVNLAHLLVGAEGTLALTRSLTLALSELPRARVLGVANFPTFRAAMEAAQHIVRLGPTAVELVDRTMIDLGLANPAFAPTIRSALVGEPAAILLVEFCGSEAAAIAPRLRELAELMGDLGLPGSVVPLLDEGAQGRLWDVRKAGLNIMMSLKGDGKPVSFIEDCAVPLQHLAEYTDALSAVFARHGTRGTWYAHASVGTLHVRPILDMRRDGAVKMRAIAEEAAELVRRYRGAYSGEHGDGLCRGEWIRWQFGPSIDAAFAAIKREMDPAGLFNPQRIVDPPPMDRLDLLRTPPGAAPRPYQTITLQPALDWSAWNVQNDPASGRIGAPGSGGDPSGGFAKAVEMCNNNGHCRKFDAGTMCPSFRVTRDEQHLTRGRANTLRLALAGELGADALTGAAVAEALDLCVGCKGCRRECPTGVDMARMKIEVRAQRAARHGLRLFDRLVGALPDYAHLASRHAWLLNLRDRVPGAPWLGEHVFGLSARRALPRWRTDTFWRSVDAGSLIGLPQAIDLARSGGKVVALFVDTFNGIFEPDNALAAVRLLRAGGYAVHVVAKPGSHYCCGRTYLATGQVDKARAHAAALIHALLPLARAGVSIVGLEPSCLLTLRDEALVLGLGENAEQVASRACLFEEFIAGEARERRLALDLRPWREPILVHGHCHQKAFGTVGAVLETLRLVPGADPQLIESSCCGMAGSFGYEAAHHDISLAMAEDRLLPALRERPAALVVADGTSCRQQIASAGGRQAVSVAAFLARQLLP